MANIHQLTASLTLRLPRSIDFGNVKPLRRQQIDSKMESVIVEVKDQITAAFPWDEAPRYLIRDWDRIFGAIVADCAPWA